MTLYELVGTKNSNINWTTEIVLERDANGNVTKSLAQGSPVELDAAQAEELSAQGYVLEKVTKKELKERGSASDDDQVAGADVAAASPPVSAIQPHKRDRPDIDQV